MNGAAGRGFGVNRLTVRSDGTLMLGPIPLREGDPVAVRLRGRWVRGEVVALGGRLWVRVPAERDGTGPGAWVRLDPNLPMRWG